MPQSPVFWLLVACVLAQFYYWFYYFGPFARRPTEAPADAPGPADEPVSVVVCARNELENLRRLLPLLLKQDYPAGFEIVLVDDRSHDDTQAYAQQLGQYYAGRFRLVTVKGTPDGFAPKKYALTLGIKAACHARLLFTDADCIPATNQWLRLLQRGFGAPGAPGADLVLGFSGYAAGPGLLNRLIRYETLLTAAQYLSFAWRGRPYMGVGRNLGYTRATFAATKGFASHIRRLSGDDDLLVQDAVAQGLRAAVVADPPAHTLSEPAATWAAWWTQKRRHLSAGSRYRLADRVRIGAFVLANVLAYALTAGLLFSPEHWVPLVVVWVLRTFALAYVYGLLGQRLEQKLPPVWLPLLDGLYFAQYVTISLSLLFKRTLRWK
ncbi:MAG: glycosyltransferase [Janthinobacterium lividum]